MLECRDIDALMMDWLYHELQRDQAGEFTAHVDDCARCQSELATFERTREALRELPEVEPPSSISAILLHEAARTAPAAARPAAAAPDADRETGGVLGFLSRLFRPMVMHPAAAAVATLVLVAGVAGSLYIRGDHSVATVVVDDEAEPAVAATEELGSDMVRMPDDNVAASPSAGQTGYTADIAPLESEARPAPGNAEPAQVTTAAGDSFDDSDKRREKPARSARGTKRTSKAEVPTTANAVSGADLLVDADDDAVGGKLRGKVPELASSKKKAPAKPGARKRDVAQPTPAPPPEPATEGAYRAYKDQKQNSAADAERERAWAAGQERQLDEAVRLKRCRDAARIANDILDRNPAYYYQRVDRSKSVKTCSGFVADERNKRAEKRGKRRAAQPKKGKGASAPAKARAAPEADAAESSK